jgi:hypothetical protein
VRNFVQAVRQHPECTGTNFETFSEWARKVLEFADSIDPLVQPISNILRIQRSAGITQEVLTCLTYIYDA